jgi:O-antigen ligase
MLIRLSKLFFVLLLFYYGWFMIVFFQIPQIMLLLGVGMIGFIILDAILTHTDLSTLITFELWLWILFAATSLGFGYFVAVDRGFLTDQLSTFVQFLMLIYGIIYISNKEESINFFIKVFIVYAVVCALTTIRVDMVDIEGRAIMGLTDNPNAVGITMAIGICCILYMIDLKKFLYTLISFGAILLMIYVALLSGSRKAFLSIVLIIGYSIVFVLLKEIKFLRPAQKLKGIFSIALVSAAGYSALYEYFKSSILLDRLTAMLQGSETTRIGMYDAAFELFKGSPLVGVGFNNYRALSGFGTYSHSTYAEALACTGIIGCLLYFIPYLTTLFHYMKIVANRKVDALLLQQGRTMMGLYAVLLFLGIGTIHFYEITSSIEFGMIFAFYHIYKKKTSQAGIIEEGGTGHDKRNVAL